MTTTRLAGYTLYRNGNAIATVGRTPWATQTQACRSNTTLQLHGRRVRQRRQPLGTLERRLQHDRQPVLGRPGGSPLPATSPAIRATSRFNGGAGIAWRMSGAGHVEHPLRLGSRGRPAARRRAVRGRDLVEVHAVLRCLLGDGSSSYQAGARETTSTRRQERPATTATSAAWPAIRPRATTAYDIGAWHIIALNSECANIGGCGTGSPQTVWLRNDLAAHSNTCTLAYWHRPRFSVGPPRKRRRLRAWWYDLYNAHADIVLNGHDHDYERFAPQDRSQNPDPNGIREFVVGHRRAGARAFRHPVHEQRRSSTTDTFGVLKLTLHPDELRLAVHSRGGRDVYRFRHFFVPLRLRVMRPPKGQGRSTRIVVLLSLLVVFLLLGMAARRGARLRVGHRGLETSSTGVRRPPRERGRSGSQPDRRGRR
mgnify:CR=1 FL=1